MPALLEIKNLKTQFSTQGRLIRAVDGVSYDIQEGETLAVVGESGCGKSVTALSIMGLIPYPPGRIVDGEILFQGKDLLKMSPEQMRKIRGKEISMIFQEPMTSLNPVLTIERQLTETMEAHMDMEKEDVLKRALEVMDWVGISDPERRLSQYPHHFSGGMRQRVMIAMALACNPKLILADEPTTALDVTIQAQILALMKDLSTRFGVAMILITHNLGIVARYADRVNVMYAAQIIEKGTAKDVYARPVHPYTLGLLKSVPRLDETRKSKLEPIEGQPPDLGALNIGCRFRDRCFLAEEKCAEEDMPLVQVNKTQWSACWKYKHLRKAS
ncbi:MAG: ABC transporter ATP-binding protein [SAR324 cluster bacterium]|nr:ABC transporter ATP-binding protein [SAR324 cluster bacterium]MCZ6533314.1 ABC transporter ATP-binding protein [SAR324 cluster bacterium]MCZ6629594.1 ABC transporter ATP-binding protein [SAR324 cluster bacterium]MCZ6646623.1 ABC transporter ATP-binding protein [SAR324 cluster bacterium]MCZ6730819.1 ABC transporter ATP-binding protein [SAR324 cluster bacterium]